MFILNSTAMVVLGHDLYTLVISSESPEDKASVISELKTYVKKDNVDFSQVPKYFEALSVAMDTTDANLQSMAFSTICHLVKRVSIQDTNGNLLAEQSFLVLPILIPRIADKPSIKVSARRALEAYWLSAPEKVDLAVVDVGFSHRSTVVINECVVWLNHILTTINPHFKLDEFLAPLADILVKHELNSAVVENIKTLFANYYDLKHNSLHKFELQRVLEKHNVSPFLRSTIMGTDNVLRDAPKVRSEPRTDQRAGKPELKKHESRESRSESRNDTRESGNHSSRVSEHSESNSPLNVILSTLPNYDLDNIQSLDVSDPSSMFQMVTDMQQAFENKETERNWIAREKHIVTLRSVLRGNALRDFLPDFLLCVREIHNGICKALQSLRTTLTVNSCQFVKEMAIILHTHFDVLMDLFLPTLIKMSSATKTLTNSNANVAVSAILANCTFSSKLLHRIQLASSDKSTSTKAYSAYWLQIFIVRLREHGNLASSGSTDIIEKILPRLLADPNSQVRQNAKDSFWSLREFYPEPAETLLTKLDTNVIRALERSKPSGLNCVKAAPALLAKRSRPSLKETIIAKNKELKSKQQHELLSRSNSRNLPHRISEPPQLDVSQRKTSARTASDLSTRSVRNTRPALPLPSKSSEPHYASSTFAHRSSSNGSRSFRAVSEPSNDHVLKGQSSGRAFDHPASFDKKSDPILKFLSSSQDEFIREGVNLLRYAIIGDEDLPSEVSVLLRKVSIAHPEYLKPLFEEGENLLRKTKHLFAPEDFVRVCSILLPATERNVDVIISLLNVDEVYHSVVLLLSYVADLENIVDERYLVMQVIKYKGKILDMLVNFLIQSTSKIPISDVNFAKLTTNLFELISIVHPMETYDAYQQLLKTLYAINSVLFSSQLAMATKGSKKEIKYLVGIDDVLEFKAGDATVFNMSELTQIAPGKTSMRFSPLKEPSDFTMLLPVRRAGPDSTILLRDAESMGSSLKSPHSDPMEIDANHRHIDSEPVFDRIVQDDVLMEDVEEIRVVQRRSTSFPKAKDLRDASPRPVVGIEEPLAEGIPEPQEVPIPRVDTDVFTKLDTGGERTDFFAKLHSDSSSELVDDFAQVKITNRVNSIQSFIDKVDPLSKISSRNRPVSIFEDSKAGSPQKVREYSYTELNWFNFLVAKLALEKDAQEFEEYTIEEFKLLCNKLSHGKVSGSQFISLLRYLQNTQSYEFNQYYDREGHACIEQSLWKSFGAAPLAGYLSGLMLLKQLLINRDSVDLHHLWSTLVEVSETAQDPLEELSTAVGETFDEALCGVYSSGELLHEVTKTLKDRELGSKSMSFVLESLLKLISMKTLTLTINDEFVRRIDEVLNGLLNHKEAEIRKNVIQTYGKMVRAVRVSDLSGGNKAALTEKTGSGTIDEILQTVTGPQRKMIEYFSR